MLEKGEIVSHGTPQELHDKLHGEDFSMKMTKLVAE
jgi:hypothetical protein